MKKILISVLSFLWFIEFKPYEGLGFIARYKWWHPLSYVAIILAIIGSICVIGLKRTFKEFESPFKWHQPY